ncbi:sugar porter family MFS transporter [Mycolicibacterium novocastrense]|nr:sugar porter family MFS transporter [Mycolicibacterium novocastrense]
MAVQGTGKATLLAAAAACGGFLFGFDTSTMNSAINGIAPSLALSSGQVGFITAIALIGAAVGAWFAGGISARFGRDRVMVRAGALIAAGSVLAALADDVWVLGAVRILAGLGIGAASAVVPAYVSEISPVQIRGRLGTFWQFAIVFGQFLGLLSGYLLASLGGGSESGSVPWGGAAWRWMFAVVAVLGLAYVVMGLRLPASPADLVRFQRYDDAAQMMTELGDEAPKERITAMRAQLDEDRSKAGLAALRGNRMGLKTIVWVGVLLAAFQQLVGINVVKTYSNAVWQSVGVPVDASFMVSLITVGVSIVSTVIAIAIMDRVGRRTLLIAGALGMVPSLATLAIVFGSAVGEPSLTPGSGIAALVAMNVFAVAFGITWGPVMWLMLGELFDTQLRTAAVAVCTAVNWLTNWLITRTFPLLADIGLGFAYTLYTVFAVAALVFAWKMLPETKNRTLD